jgi:hypothetical protein
MTRLRRWLIARLAGKNAVIYGSSIELEGSMRVNGLCLIKNVPTDTISPAESRTHIDRISEN